MANDLRTPTLAPRGTGGAGANGPIRAHIPQILTPTDYRPEQVRQLNSAIKEHNDQLFGIYLMRVQATAKEKDNELAKASQALCFLSARVWSPSLSRRRLWHARKSRMKCRSR